MSAGTTVATPGAGAIGRLLRPRSVAVVGASATPGALGAYVLEHLQRRGFAGEIHLINPNRTEIHGRPCLLLIDDLPMGVDAAVLAIPRPGVLPAVRALAGRGVGAVVIFSAGFAESGEPGRAEQEEIARIAAEHGMLVEGPNCLGMVNHVDGIALTFVDPGAAPLRGRPGIGIVSQSGAMACVLGTVLAGRDLPVTYSISTGNEAASTVEDYLAYLLDDANTQVAALIVEQFRRPRRFLALAREAAERGKTLVLLHPGRSLAARRSAATHTGALAADYAVMRARVEAAGVVLVETLEELGDALDIAARALRPAGPGTAVVTESGAFKALALDLSEEVGLDLPRLDDGNAPALRAAMPAFVSVSNPLDLTAQGLVDPDIYRRTLTALAGDERFGAVLLTLIQTDQATLARKLAPILAALRGGRAVGTVGQAGADDSENHPMAARPGEETRRGPDRAGAPGVPGPVERQAGRAAKPRGVTRQSIGSGGMNKTMLVAGLDEGAPVSGEHMTALRELRVPCFPSPDRALRALARVMVATRPPAPEPVREPEYAISLITAGRDESSETVVPEYRAKAILAEKGIAFPRGRLVHSLDQAQAFAASLGGAVALKAQSAELIHKTDAGGVVLNVRGAEAVAAGWAALHAEVARRRPGLVLEGVLVEAMARPGVEFIVGGRNDAAWGPMVLAGFGGVQAELYHDIRLIVPGLSAAAIAGELRRLKGAAVLDGYRGAPALDVPALVALIERVGKILSATPGVAEIDLNPVTVYPVGDGVVALDASLIAG